jgi:hypothetical protein
MLGGSVKSDLLGFTAPMQDVNLAFGVNDELLRVYDVVLRMTW